MSKIRNVAVSVVFSLALLFVFLLPANFSNLIVHAVDTLEVAAGMMLPDGFDVLPDGKGNFFITSYDSRKLQSTVAYLDNAGNGVITHMDYNTESLKNTNYKYTTASYYSNPSQSLDNCICFTCLNSDKTIVKKIVIDQNLCIENLNLPLSGLNIDSPLKIAVYDDDVIFFINSNDDKTVFAYSLSSGALNETGLTCGGKAFHSIFTDVSKKYLYALNSSNDLVRCKVDNKNNDKYTFEAPENTINVSNLKFVTDNIFVTPDRRIITLNKYRFKADSEVEIAAEIKDFPYCVVAGFDDASILIKTEDKVISRIRCSDGAVTGKIELTEDVLAISKSGDKIIAITGAGTGSNKHIALLKEADIKEVTPAKPSNPGDGSSGEGGDNNNPPSGADDDAITSDIYTVDTQNLTITGIEPGTTFAAFKNNLIFNGYSLGLKKGATAKPIYASSTKVATGNFASFERDGAEKVLFKLIVTGDVTGTGTLNSRDISAFENYLLGKTELNEESLQAANINGDGDQDVIDLFLMSKLMQK